MHNIKDRFASVLGNFFEIRLNIASGVLLHSEDNTGRYLIFTCSQFREELISDFELYVNPGDVATQKNFLDYLT